MKNKNYLIKVLLYALAVISAAFVFWAVLAKAVAIHDCDWYFALISAFITLGGDIALLVNYLKKSSKAWPIFSVMIALISGVPLAMFIGYTIITITIISVIYIIASAVCFSLNLFFIFYIESKKESDLEIAEMHRMTDESIAEMRKQTAASIAEMRRQTAANIARMRKDSAAFIAEMRRQTAESIAKMKKEDDKAHAQANTDTLIAKETARTEATITEIQKQTEATVARIKKP